MDPATIIINFFDLFGTVIFAISGAGKAIEHKTNVVGVITLGIITGIAGGTFRDLLLIQALPNSITNPIYVTLCTVTAISYYFLYPKLKKPGKIFAISDALGIGAFTTIGAQIAFEVVGLEFLAISLAGMLTAVGGGVIRDVMVGEHPLIFKKEFYALSSLFGIVVFYITTMIFEIQAISQLLTFTTTALILITIIRFRWIQKLKNIYYKYQK